MKKIRVLSLDGGGIRGIIPATVLAYVEDKLKEITQNSHARIADYFDMIAGTSTGGILTCFYLVPNPDPENNPGSSKYNAHKALEMYTNEGYRIFNQSRCFGWFGLRQLFNATRYSPKNIEQIFREEFGDLKMSELLKPCLVTTYNMSTKNAFFFSSRESAGKKREFYVRDVTRSTSAAPTYFPPARIKNLETGEKMVNIDGGVFANNPGMCAYSECRDTNFPKNPYPTAKDMLILSIGTGGGQFDLPDPGKSNKWGIVKWAKSTPEIMMDGSLETVNYQMQLLFNSLEKAHQYNIKRVNVPTDKRNYANNMADASPENIKKLKIAGNEALKDANRDKPNELKLDDFIKLLVENE